MSIGLPPTIVINEKEQMMQVQQQVTSFTYLLEFEDYFKYCASRTSGVAMVMNQLYERVFADPSYAPMLAMATNFVQFLSEIKMRMPNAVEYNVVTHIEVKHYRRFWKRRSAVLSTDVLGNSHFLRIQIERIQGLPSAFDIAFDAIPFVRFAGNISIYRSKQELIDIGNCIEIGEPEPAQDPISAFQQQMDSASVPNRHRPWYMLVDESNIEAYEAVLKYIINKAYLGSKLKIDKFR